MALPKRSTRGSTRTNGKADATWYYDKLKVTGIRDLRSTLRKADIKGKALKPAYQEASEFAADVARAAAPTKTGKLKGSIKARPTSTMARIEMGGGVKYTFLSELGGGAHWRSRTTGARKAGQKGRTAKGGTRYATRVPIKGGIRMASRLYIFQKPHRSPDNFGGYHVLPAIRQKADDIARVFLKSIDRLLEAL